MTAKSRIPATSSKPPKIIVPLSIQDVASVPEAQLIYTCSQRFEETRVRFNTATIEFQWRSRPQLRRCALAHVNSSTTGSLGHWLEEQNSGCARPRKHNDEWKCGNCNLWPARRAANIGIYIGTHTRSSSSIHSGEIPISIPHIRDAIGYNTERTFLKYARGILCLHTKCGSIGKLQFLIRWNVDECDGCSHYSLIL